MEVRLTREGIESEFVHCVHLPFEDAVGVHLHDDKKEFVVSCWFSSFGRLWRFYRL